MPRWGLLAGSLGVHADLFFAGVLRLETDDAIDLGEQGIVLADAHVVARMEVRAALAHEDVAGEHELAVRTLGSEPLALAVTAVARGTDALFMCKQLQIHLEHVSHLLTAKFEVSRIRFVNGVQPG